MKIKQDIFIRASVPLNHLEEQFQTSLAEGLSHDVANAILHRDGPNEITAKHTRWWEIAGRQFKSPFIYLLMVAALIVYAIGEYIDPSIIVGFVCINAGPSRCRIALTTS